jgi:hypothetical protein
MTGGCPCPIYYRGVVSVDKGSVIIRYKLAELIKKVSSGVTLDGPTTYGNRKSEIWLGHLRLGRWGDDVYDDSSTRKSRPAIRH